MTGHDTAIQSRHSPRVLLLHGAYHDARIWSLLRDCLGELGVASLAPTLDLEDPLILDEIVEALPGPLYIVAHSLAGALVGEWLASGSSKIGSVLGIAYLTAYIPQPGESVTQLVRQDRGSVVPALLQRGPSQDCVQLSESGARKALYNDAPPGLDLSPFLQGLQPQRTAAFSRPREAPLPSSSLPNRIYLICRHDRAITPDLQRRMAESAHCNEVHELDADHMPMVTSPQALSHILTAAWQC